MAKIGEEEQQYSDFDWFCIDSVGEVGHFTTAGYKQLPPSVACSAEGRNPVTEFFENELKSGRGYFIDAELVHEIPPPQSHTERYLQSFVAMANKGLYSFDIETYLKPGICYFRVAVPLVPILFAELPLPIQDILRRTELKGKLLRNSARIPYEDTLGM